MDFSFDCWVEMWVETWSLALTGPSLSLGGSERHCVPQCISVFSEVEHCLHSVVCSPLKTTFCHLENGLRENHQGTIINSYILSVTTSYNEFPDMSKVCTIKTVSRPESLLLVSLVLPLFQLFFPPSLYNFRSVCYNI